MKNSTKAKNKVMALLKSLTGVYTISPFIGNEVIITMDNLSRVYVNFSYNDSYDKIKLSTQFGLDDLKNHIIVI